MSEVLAAEPVIIPRPLKKMGPLAQSIQLALFRRTRDGVPRIKLLGERIVKDALAGNEAMTKIVVDRIDGKLLEIGEDGEPVHDLSAGLIGSLIEALVDKKLGTAAKVIEGAVETAARTGEATVEMHLDDEDVIQAVERRTRERRG